MLENRSFAVQFKQSSSKCNPVSLLVPNHILPLLNARLIHHQVSLAIYLRNLITKYESLLLGGYLPSNSHSAVAVKYQNSDDGFRKLPLRPGLNEWLILSKLSRVLGYSRCYTFTLLIQLDVSGVAGEVRVPTKYQHFLHPKYRYTLREHYDPENGIIIRSIRSRMVIDKLTRLILKYKEMEKREEHRW